jgi:hypothetical protein
LLQNGSHRLNKIAAFFTIVIPSHQPNNVLRKRGERKLRPRDGRRSDLPIREVTKARAGKLAPWRDCVGKFVPGPLRALPLQESLGKRNTKKMGVWETYLMVRRRGREMEESGKEISMREYPLSRSDNRTAAVADSIYVYLLLEWMVEYSFYEHCPSTIRIGEGAISSALVRSCYYGLSSIWGGREPCFRPSARNNYKA